MTVLMMRHSICFYGVEGLINPKLSLLLLLVWSTGNSCQMAYLYMYVGVVFNCTRSTLCTFPGTFQTANVTSIIPQETVATVVHIPRISAGFSMRLSQKAMVRRKTFMELKSFKQVDYECSYHTKDISLPTSSTHLRLLLFYTTW